MKLKQRAKWWIVSTHVLTTGFAMPFVAGIVGGVLCAVLGLEAIVAFLFILAVKAIGYIGGTYYSLSYLKKSAVTHDWPGCTVPAIVSFAVLAPLGMAVDAIWMTQSTLTILGPDAESLELALAVQQLGLALFYGLILAAFSKITAKGFIALQEQAKQPKTV